MRILARFGLLIVTALAFVVASFAFAGPVTASAASQATVHPSVEVWCC